MKTLRNVINSPTLKERKTVVGALGNAAMNIYNDKIRFPHQIMSEVEMACESNPIFRSSLETITDFIYGGEIKFKSDDKMTEIRGNQLIKDLNFDEWVPPWIKETVKTGNGYVEMDFNPVTGLPHKFYPQALSSRWYINCNEFGKPKTENKLAFDKETNTHKMVSVPNLEEYYVQQIDAGARFEKAKWFDMSYHMAGIGKFRTFRVYGIPVHKNKIIHTKLNLGTTGIYGNSHFGATLNDNEILKQLERSIAIIARYKAVPRKVITYGDKDLPASGDELDDFIIYLESLERDEDPITNKPMKVDDLSYAGGDINLDYMIQHIRKKLFGGVIPDFLTGYGDQINRATSETQLIAFVLSIYAKRKVFLKRLEEVIINPWLKHENLKTGHLEFSELDFETKSEKMGRSMQMWTSNAINLNRFREINGEAKLGDEGDVFYTEWQNTLMSKGMQGQESPSEFGFNDIQNNDEVQNDIPDEDYNNKYMPDVAGLPPENYSLNSDIVLYEHANYENTGSVLLKETLDDDCVMISDPSGLDPIVTSTAIFIRKNFRKKLEQVRKFKTKNSLEMLKEDLQAKDVRELALYLKIGEGDIKPKFDQAIEQAWLKGSSDAGKEIGLDTGIPTTPFQMQRIKNKSWKYVNKNLIKGSDKIEDVLNKGLFQKVSGKEFEKEVESVYKFIGWKSEQIAITELRKAHSAGVRHVLERSSFKEWRWRTSSDEKVCPVCRPKNGKIFSINNKMENMPPEHPHCRCSAQLWKGNLRNVGI